MPVLLIQDFSGGKNTRFRQNVIQDNQTPDCRNVRLRRQGGISKRFGSTHIAVTGSGGQAFGAHAYALTGMSAEAMIVFTRESPAYVARTTDGTTFSDVTGAFNTGQTIDLTAQTQLIHFVTFDNLVFAHAEYMDTRSYDNTTWVRIATANNVFPRSRFAVVHKNRVFAGYLNYGSTDFKSRIKWSDYADNVWQSANFEDLHLDDGTVIRGMASYGDELIVWKGPENASQSWMHSKMFRILGDVFDATSKSYIIEQIPMTEGVGLLGQDGWAIYRGKLIFLCNDGFYEYTGGGRAPVPSSEIINEDMKDLVVSAFNEADSKPAAFVFDDRFYCSVRSTRNSSEGYNNRVYILDGEAWTIDIISSTADSNAVGDGVGQQYTRFLGNIYFVPVTSSTFSGIARGAIRRIEVEDQFTENAQNEVSANVNFSYTTKEFTFDRERFIRSVFVHLKRQSSGTLTFGYNLDQRGESTTSIDMTAADDGTTETSSSSVFRKEFWVGQMCRTHQWRFHDRNNNDCEIYALEIDYK